MNGERLAGEYSFYYSERSEEKNERSNVARKIFGMSGRA